MQINAIHLSSHMDGNWYLPRTNVHIITFYESLSFKHFIGTYAIYYSNTFTIHSQHMRWIFVVHYRHRQCFALAKKNRISLTEDWIYDSESKSQNRKKKLSTQYVCTFGIIIYFFVEVICYTNRFCTFSAITTFESMQIWR